MYTIEYDKAAVKTLEKISKRDKISILEAIEELAKNPRPSGLKNLRGRYNGYYRIRCGNFRIIYEIHDKQLRILVVKIGDRKDVYD